MLTRDDHLLADLPRPLIVEGENQIEREKDWSDDRQKENEFVNGPAFFFRFWLIHHDSFDSGDLDGWVGRKRGVSANGGESFALIMAAPIVGQAVQQAPLHLDDRFFHSEQRAFAADPGSRASLEDFCFDRLDIGVLEAATDSSRAVRATPQVLNVLVLWRLHQLLRMPCLSSQTRTAARTS